MLLQAGSLIVEALRTYRQPVTVYLPPGAELRGGAWVVVDGQINADQVGRPALTGRQKTIGTMETIETIETT